MHKLRASFFLIGAAAFFAFSSEGAFAAHTGKDAQAKETGAAPEISLKNKKILFVLSSRERLEGQSPRKTGLWAQSLAAPYEILTKEGATITLASVKGGKPPIDPRSVNSDFATSYTKAFSKDATAQQAFAHTLPLSQVKASDYDAICYTSSYGMMYDLIDNPDSERLLTDFARARKPMGFTSQGASMLKNIKDVRGKPIVQGREVTAFRNSEEAGSKLALDHAIFPVSILKTMDHGRTYKTAALPEDKFLKKLKLVGTVPFLTETLLKSLGAEYKSQKNWVPFVVEEVTADGGILLTGQNPDSVVLWTQALSEILANPTQEQGKIASSGPIERVGEPS